MDRIMVTGSREFSDLTMIAYGLESALKALDYPSEVILVTGACPTGADQLAEMIWFGVWKRPVIHYEADWKKLGMKAGPVRNSKMVKDGADVCLAFYVAGEGKNRGTKDCVKKAKTAGIPVWEYYPRRGFERP